MSFPLYGGATQVDDVQVTPLTAADLNILLASLSAWLASNPEYRVPGNDEPFQTTIVAHGGAVFVMLLESRETTCDIDFLGGYTDVLLENRGLNDPIELISKEIGAVGEEMELEGGWMNFMSDIAIGQIGDGVVDDEELDVLALVGTQSVEQGITLYEDPGLLVYVMEWCWAFCCKLNRFNKQDAEDIHALLTHINHSALQTAEMGDIMGAVEELWIWVEISCPLQALSWRRRHLEETIRDKIREVAKDFVI